MVSPFLKAFMALSGLTGLALGAAILLAPVAFYSSYDLAGQVTLLNEMRSHGLALGGAGLLIATGAFAPRFASTSLAIAAFVYLSYGLSRLVGLAIDGRPADGLLVAMAAELAIGTLSALAYLRRRNAMAAA
ncbi:DUF4345 family protein [Devosia nitrariae]|uniref:DUF4345 domain-containing protein n=1 Tax=Devosia nitrariae TaxID=2071872 RepID=A0ABQ5W063_9HYPH|nr:DUF4345 family protein [Devosia nitrariae]GLQ53454.1 hypothetical protein GCM10010862_07120 [Devosia nitrariae]